MRWQLAVVSVAVLGLASCGKNESALPPGEYGVRVVLKPEGSNAPAYLSDDAR